MVYSLFSRPYLSFLNEYKARFYELMEQRFLGTEEFVEDIRSKRLQSTSIGILWS